MTERTPPDIRVPAALLPSDGRFGSGPSKVRAEAVAALAAEAPRFLGTSHRQPTVRSVVASLRSGLRELFSLPEDHQVVLGNGGATLFWDVATFCLVETKSQHCSFGEFSSKFAAAAAAAPHLADPDVREVAPGGVAHPESDPTVDAYALTHNETSTGASMEIRRPAGADGLVLVDATSAAGGLRVDPGEFDAYYFAPQKCFASDGGLWIALLSPAASERARRLTSARWVPASLDLAIAMDNSALDQTYNTPALATLFLMEHQLAWMLDNGGLEWCASRCDDSADRLYGWAEASDFARPFVAKPDERSHVVGTIDLDDAVNAETVAQVLRANGIVDTESYRRLNRNQLRIAMFPAVEPSDVSALCACIDHVVAALS